MSPKVIPNQNDDISISRFPSISRRRFLKQIGILGGGLIVYFTTGDSSLSVGVQSILAAEIGYMEKALAYANYAVLMDLGNVEGNVKDGCHIASMGASWMVLVNGFGGMRDHGGELSFHPSLPECFKRLRFPLTFRGQLLEVDIEQEAVTYLLQEGTGLTIKHQEKEIKLLPGEPVTVKIQPR